MKKITLAELAVSLGLSKTLVSLVLNDKGDAYGISKLTQKRVRAKAAELNYRPNSMAKALRTGKTNVIGLIVADISNSFYAQISRSIEDHVAKHGYQLIVCSSEENAEKERALITMLTEEYQVSGLIISTTQSEAKQFQQLKENNFPFVLIDRSIPKFKANFVGVNNREGAFDATMHLVKIGYKRIAILKISPSYLSTIREREKGYRDALKAAGLKYDPAIAREIDFDSMKACIYKELRELLAPPHSVEAIFVVNNNLVSYSLEYLQEAGIRVPQDVALVCFDDVDYFRFSNPPVTAVEQPLNDIGEEAVELLMLQINAKKKISGFNEVILPAKLIVRKSCGKFLKIK